MIISRPLSLLLALGLFPFVSSLRAGEATKPDALETLPGFKLDLVRTADPATEGSWISIAKDPQGRLLVGGERKEPISRLTLKDGAVVKAEILKIPLSEVMGMLFAFDSLYLNGRGNAPDGHEIFGLWRCRPTGDDVQTRSSCCANGRAAAATTARTPSCSTRTRSISTSSAAISWTCPTDVLPTSPHRNYADDLVLPRAEDGNGFGAGRKPPGGFVVAHGPGWQPLRARRERRAQYLLRRLQSRRRAVRLRQRHGVGLGHAVVSAGARLPCDQRRGPRLPRGREQVARILPRQPARHGHDRHRLPDRRGVRRRARSFPRNTSALFSSKTGRTAGSSPCI